MAKPLNWFEGVDPKAIIDESRLEVFEELGRGPASVSTRARLDGIKSVCLKVPLF